MRIRKLAMLFTLVLTGCANYKLTTPYEGANLPRIPRNYSQIIVYIPENIWIAGTKFLVNDQETCPVLPGSYLAMNYPAGILHLKTDATMATPGYLDLDAKAGHRYVLRLQFNKPGASSSAAGLGLLGSAIYGAANSGTPDFSIQVVEEKFAKNELMRTKKIVCK